MRPRRHILICISDEFKAAELKLILETRLLAKVVIAEGVGLVSAVHSKQFSCAVLINGSKEVIDFLRAREIPTLEIGQGPSLADRCISGSMMEILEAVKIMCVRRRGPRKAAA